MELELKKLTKEFNCELDEKELLMEDSKKILKVTATGKI